MTEENDSKIDNSAAQEAQPAAPASEGNHAGRNGSSRMETSIKKHEGVDASYLSKYVKEDDSLDTLKEHRVVPRLKIIQATTDDELKKNFGEGSAVLRPGDALICKFEKDPESFDFVPLFFFVEWAKWRDLRGSGPMVLDRSHDPTSEVAVKAKSTETREELYEGHDKLPEAERLTYRYVEHLRFIGIVHGDHPLAGTPVTLSFERGEYGQGKNFISAVTMRREIIDSTSCPIPLWAQIWRLKVIHHKPDQSRKWFGFAFEPADPAIISKDEAEELQALHVELKTLHEQQRLTVQDEPTEQVVDEAAVKGKTEF